MWPSNHFSSWRPGPSIFQYEDLRNGYFRLLKFDGLGQSQHAASVLNCEIKHFSIRDHPPYTALSYSIKAAQWTGAYSHFGFMYCNGKEYHVKDGLLHIIAKLLDPYNTTYLWIDQICINQPDWEEMDSQLEMMQDIYSNATQTIIWLGYPEDNQACVDGAFAALHRHYVEFSSAQQSDEVKRRTALINLQRGSVFTTYESTLVVNILRRPWFSRIWVLQEATLSKNAIIQCGTFRMRWADFLLQLACLRTTGMLNALLTWPDPMGETTPHQWEVRYHTFLGLFALFEANRHGPAWGVKTAPSPPKLKQILLTARFFDASKPKDRIYAIRGLCEDKDFVRVRNEESYTLAALYHDVAKYITSPDSSACACDRVSCPQKQMSVLGAAGLRNWNEDCFKDFTPAEVRAVQGLPSWVPIWTSQSFNTFFFSADEADYRACGHTPPILEIEEKKPGYGKLKLEGIIIDEVLSKSSTCPSLWLGAFKPDPTVPRQFTLLHKLRFMGNWLQEVFRMSGLNPQSPNLEAFCRTLCGNTTCGESASDHLLRKPIVDGRRLVRSFLDYMEVYRFVNANWHQGMAYLSSCGHLLQTHEAGTDYWDKASEFAVSGRTFVLTKAGRMGLAPPQTQPGDRLCVFFGSPTPMILRATQVMEEFKLIGECYVHGLMNGEALDIRPTGNVPIALV